MEVRIRVNEKGQKEKFCSLCREWLPVEQFNKNKNNPDGYQDHCKACQHKYVMAFKKYPGMQLKWCHGCNDYLPIDYFDDENKKKRHGLCRRCVAKSQANGKVEEKKSFVMPATTIRDIKEPQPKPTPKQTEIKFADMVDYDKIGRAVVTIFQELGKVDAKYMSAAESVIRETIKN